MAAQFWWVIFPYLSVALMLGGSLYRYAHNQLSWGSRSSEILERRLLKWGSLLFHVGILLVIGGHVMGLLVPVQLYQALGVSRTTYHHGADILGGLAGLATWIGLALLLIRRFSNRRVLRNSSVADVVALILLFVVVSTGDAVTLGYNNLVGPYGYRRTVGPWVRGLITFQPHASLMTHVPPLFQVHILLGLCLFAVVPFTRLVHFWSVPLAYVRRAPIQYRARDRYRPRPRT